MSKGYYLMHRGWMDSPVFDDCKSEPFNERLAWLWLIEKACFEPHKVRYKSRMIEVDAGQVPTSYRRLQETWGWGAGKVQRFLKLLENDGMIGTQTGTGFLIITICNYSKYQKSYKDSGTQMEQKPERKRNASGTNIKNGKEIKEINNPLTPLLGQELAEKLYQHRRELKKPLKPTQAEALAKKLAKMKNPVAAVEDAIANGWQGIFDKPEYAERQNRNNRRVL